MSSTATPARDPSRLPLWLQALIVTLVAIGVFAGTLGHELVWDDTALVALVDRVTEGDALPGGLLQTDFRLRTDEPMGYYRPVVLLSLWADARVSSISRALTSTYHLTNVLLHALVSGFVLLLLRRIPEARRFALGGALLFAVHPVHTEAVAFVSGRTDLWAALFILISAWLWARSRRSPGVAVIAGSLLALLGGILSKEVALVLPMVLLACDWIRPGAGGGWWARNRVWIPGWLGVGIVAAMMRWGLAGVGFGLTGGADTARLSPLLSQPSLIAEAMLLYLRLLVAPWPLNAYYTAGDLEWSWVSLLAAGAWFLGCGLTSARRYGRAGLVALAWTGGFLLPVLGAVPVSSAAIAERYLYVPSFGLALMISVLLGRLAERVPAARLAFVGVLPLALMGYGTMTRAAVWHDAESLFGSLASSSPAYIARARNNLGVQLQSMGRHGEAADLFRQALTLQPAAPEVLNNLGTSLLALGMANNAEEQYRAALRIRPKMPEPRFGLGMALLRQGRVDEAWSESTRLEAGSPALAATLRREIEARARQGS